MKTFLVTILIYSTLILLPSCAGPEETKALPAPSIAATPPENVEDVITQLENDWVAAIVKKDVARIEGLLASDFNGTSPTGSTFPKSEAINELKNGNYTVESMTMDEVSVNVYGNTAVSFTSQQEKSKVNGKDNSGHYHFTNVWVNKDGAWQVVASHGSRLVTAR
jgi:ketosteroid isomerase-like protein